jgi:hypothetical protein
VTGAGATGLPLAPVRDLEIHPAADGAHWLYAATEVGLFVSENAGQTWLVDGLYYVRVRAGNALGASPPSNEVTLRVGPEPCVVPPRNPTNVQASVNGGTVTLTSTPPTDPGLRGYRVEAGSAPVLSNLAVVDIPVSTTFSAVAPRGTYFVRMVSLSACGPSSANPEVTIVVP